MTLEEQIKWIESQLRFSIMLDDGDSKFLQSIYESLNRLKDLEK